MSLSSQLTTALPAEFKIKSENRKRKKKQQQKTNSHQELHIHPLNIQLPDISKEWQGTLQLALADVTQAVAPASTVIGCLPYYSAATGRMRTTIFFLHFPLLLSGLSSRFTLKSGVCLCMCACWEGDFYS